MASPATNFAGPNDHSHRREPGYVQVQNETEACSSRITREGRRITYRARIIQQPDRARACGSGAKSCADRRPVDPPPIIELRIYEGPSENEKDITYDYEANFFVFATLEHARHMAAGRAAGPAPNNVPVLTGSPVAGMALLERPTPAGYFIFPDLSVRHEGKYRLNFSLYEELKSQKDMDSETPDNAAIQKTAHVSHRLEVKTVPFTVYSAKKFPGLTCSTHLSQMFAEQGCRVRIRRDVRMRRRETAKGQAYDDEDEQPQGGYQYENRPRASATPDAYAAPNVGTPHPSQSETMDRQRSASIASSHAHARRQSAEHMQQQYQQGAYASPQTPQVVYQPQQWNQPPPPPQSYMAQPPYSQPQYSQAPPPPMAPPTYGYVPQQYQQEPQHSRHNSMEYPPPPRSAGTPQPQPQQHQLPPFPAYNGPAYPPPNGHYTQPPPPPAAAPPISPNIPMSAQPPTPTYLPHIKPDVGSQHQESRHYAPAPAVSGTKRDFASSFDTQPLEQPLRHGARPVVTGLDPKYNYRIEPAPPAPVTSAEDDDTNYDFPSMEYRRADGTQRRRNIPLLHS